jgi:hypothetical protein
MDAPGAREADDAPQPVEPADADGALIEWMLGLDATHRLEVAQGFADSVEVMRHARRD